MFRIEQVTSDARQKQVLVLPDGTTITLIIRFCPMQFGWFVDEISYGTFVLNGLRITNNPNMLRQFKNKIPFGLACFSQSDREPSLQQDFSSSASELFILTQADVQAYEDFLSE